MSWLFQSFLAVMESSHMAVDAAKAALLASEAAQKASEAAAQARTTGVTVALMAFLGTLVTGTVAIVINRANKRLSLELRRMTELYETGLAKISQNFERQLQVEKDQQERSSSTLGKLVDRQIEAYRTLRHAAAGAFSSISLCAQESGAPHSIVPKIEALLEASSLKHDVFNEELEDAWDDFHQLAKNMYADLCESWTRDPSGKDGKVMFDQTGAPLAHAKERLDQLLTQVINELMRLANYKAA